MARVVDNSDYEAFLRAKVNLNHGCGFDVDPRELNTLLKPHQVDIVCWAARLGRAAIFASFGLGKTAMQLELARVIQKRTAGRFLITAPLGVRQEFRRDAMLDTDKYRERAGELGLDHGEIVRQFGVSLTFIRRTEEADAPGVYITNYESVRDGKVDPTKFDGSTLDEAAILRGFGSTKTFREFMRLYDGMRYKFVATATPSPNEYIELLAYAAYLEVMDVSQAKAQPLDAKILTPTGWMRMRDIRVGESVVACDGTATRVIGVYPQGEQEIFRVTFSDGSSTEATADHLWLTQTTYERNNERRYRKGRNGSVKTTAQIAATLTPPTRNEKNHSIPLVQAVQFEAQRVLVDPWLMGALIGDGCIRKTSIVFSTTDQWMLDELTAKLPPGLSVRRTTPTSCDYSVTTTGAKGGRGPGSNQLLHALGSYDLLGERSYEKHVPVQYLFNSVDVRLALLRGLMDTDGTVHADGTMQRFATSSECLADDVQFLVQSLGGIATIRKVKTQRRDAFIVLVQLLSFNPFSLPRKAARVRRRKKWLPIRYVTSVESVGRKLTQCIAVEHKDRLYVTDDFLLTHNTR
ncbi:MAG: LAGLIDADG family homing endonuclease, partial [Terriglobales bacterium]